MDYASDRFMDWMTYEPVIGLMMVIGAAVLFVDTYRKGSFNPTSFWQWFSRILEALAVALVFMGLLWAFRSILNNNYKTFRSNHGRVSEVNYSSLKTIWGSPHVQRELNLDHYYTKKIREEIPREDPSLPPLYREREEQMLDEQNSILSASGKAKLALNTRKKGSAFYNGFDIDFQIQYEVINDADFTTRAEFRFPLADQVLYDQIKVLENGKDISREIKVTHSGIDWDRPMEPGEKLTLQIAYISRGVEHFYYQIPRPREINNFRFEVEIDQLPVEKINYPEGCLTPNSIEPVNNDTGTKATWTLNNAITTAGMGIALEKPAQPGAKITLVLRNSPLALMLLIVTIAITLLILGQKVNFLEMSLLSAVYCLLFMVMASVSDLFFGFWGSLILGNLLTLGLSYLMYRKYPSKLVQRLIYVLVLFFTLIYPLSGLFPDFQDSFNGMVTVALIVYVFFVSIYARSRIINKGEGEGESERV